MNRYRVTLTAHTNDCIAALTASSDWKKTGDNTFERLEDAWSNAVASGRSTGTVCRSGIDSKDFKIRSENLGGIKFAVIEILCTDSADSEYKIVRELTDPIFASQRDAYRHAREHFAGKLAARKVLVVVGTVGGVKVAGYSSACKRDIWIAEGFTPCDWADDVVKCFGDNPPTVHTVSQAGREIKIVLLDASEHAKPRMSTIPEAAVARIRLKGFQSNAIHPNEDGEYFVIALAEKKIEPLAAPAPVRPIAQAPATVDSELRNLKLKIQPLIMTCEQQKRLDAEYEQRFAHWKESSNDDSVVCK